MPFMLTSFKSNDIIFTTYGSCDWKHPSSGLFDYERSQNHLSAVVVLTCRAREPGHMNFKLTQQIEQVGSIGNM